MLTIGDAATGQVFDARSLHANFVNFYSPVRHVSTATDLLEPALRRYGAIITAPSNVTFFRMSDDIGAIRQTSESGGFLYSTTDYDDLHQFNVFWGDFTIDQNISSQAVDIVNVMWLGDDGSDSAQTEDELVAARAVAVLSDRVWEVSGRSQDIDRLPNGQKPHQQALTSTPVENGIRSERSRIAFIYGVRAIQHKDQFGFKGFGSILGTTYFDTGAHNDVVGPEAGIAWSWNHGPLSIHAQGLALAGYNYGKVDQYGRIGEERRIPGAVNRPLYALVTDIDHVQSNGRFSPSGELVAEASFKLSDRVCLRFAWAAVFVENVMFSEERVVYSLPDMGLRDPGNERLLVQNVYCGIELVH